MATRIENWFNKVDVILVVFGADLFDFISIESILVNHIFGFVLLGFPLSFLFSNIFCNLLRY